MKDRIEIKEVTDDMDNRIIKFYLHCDLGTLWLFNREYSPGVYDYFRNSVSIAELRAYKYSRNKTLNKIVDRLPVYIRYVKQLAIEEQQYSPHPKQEAA